jgi:poly(ADP-ribose) glycohydrolase ARH3
MRDRFLGCLLGHAVGDALGAPFEGMPADVVFREFGPVRAIFDSPPFSPLAYTDDTEMTIGVAEVLIYDGTIDPARLAAAFERNYTPGRGYGPGAQRILDAVRAGGDWQALAATVFPGGSLGNGAAMRVAPVGLLFHRDQTTLLEQARLSALPTHTHPVGIEAAQIFAAAIAFVLTRLVEETDQYVKLLAAGPREDVIPKKDIKDRRVSDKSVMPEGFDQILKDDEFRDLIRFVLEAPVGKN